MTEPRVFIASTFDDLKDYREAVQKVIRRAGLIDIAMEHFGSRDARPKDECLRLIREKADLFVGFYAYRYGHIPNGDEISIIEAEFNEACVKPGITKLIYLIDEEQLWLPRHMDGGEKAEKLAAFKARIDETLIRTAFTTPDQLAASVASDLARIRRDADARNVAGVSGEALDAYLEQLEQACNRVALSEVKESTETKLAPHRLLYRVYVPAVTRPRSRDAEDPTMRREVSPGIGPDFDLVLSRLSDTDAFISGEGGSGKSTFCHWLALSLVQGAVPQQEPAPPDEFAERLPPQILGKVPLLIRFADLYPLLDLKPSQTCWTAETLEEQLALAIPKLWGRLTQVDMNVWLQSPDIFWIFDGFDEVPHAYGQHTRPRSCLLSGLEDAFPIWRARGHRIIVTARPYGLSTTESSSLGIEHIGLERMSRPLQNLFGKRWFHAGCQNEEEMAACTAKFDQAMQRHDLSDLLGNPMMLSALCIKLVLGGEIPKDLADLYDGIVNFVLSSRFDRLDIKPVRMRLGVIALGMLTRQYVPLDRVDPPHSAIDPEAQSDFDRIESWLRDYLKADSVGDADADMGAMAWRETLVGKSGLLNAASDSTARFHHLLIRDYLAAWRLSQGAADFDAYWNALAAQEKWRSPLVFWFFQLLGGKADKLALGRLKPLLNSMLEAETRLDAAEAVTISECLLRAFPNGEIGDLKEPFRRLCQKALEQLPDPAHRATLFEALGRMGLDNRPGVGLNEDDLPDIDWIKIPAGQVTLENDRGTHEVGAFDMAKYPVTNAQFDAFIKDGGYDNDRWWEDVPKDARPSRPRSPRWPMPNHPKETVSWYEARAFCKWLSAKTNRSVRLPEETEWQLASGPTVYPWGDAYEMGAANCDETETYDGPNYLGQTSAVGIYSRCKSPTGIMDTSGNVWEWCQTRHERKLGDRSTRVLRGGAWLNTPGSARSALRGWSYPYVAGSLVGFRLARTL